MGRIKYYKEATKYLEYADIATPQNTLKVDASLTSDGIAADAKAVGDAIQDGHGLCV